MIDLFRFNHNQQYYKSILILCEKPSTARRITSALSQSNSKQIKSSNYIFRILNNNIEYVIISAKGHLFSINDIYSDRKIFPIFDVYWDQISTTNLFIDKHIRTIRQLSKNIDIFIHACDYDQEGEVIGYNILEHICGNKYQDSYRAKFTTLTNDDILTSFQKLQKPNINLAYSGLYRHLLDFIYGINFSRALTQLSKSHNTNMNLSIGRVQGPTLNFIIQRQLSIYSHIPIPYWIVKGKFRFKNIIISCNFEESKLDNFNDAVNILNNCKKKTAIINNIETNKEYVYPPHPFNLGDLQHECYKLFRFSPNYVMSIAERLYLKALISYPRTDSQKLDPRIDYKKIFINLSRISPKYQQWINGLLSKKSFTPNNGTKDDSAHTAIYPTGNKPNEKLSKSEHLIYDLIVRRFLSTFGNSAIRKNTAIYILVNNTYYFIHNINMFIEFGWMKIYLDKNDDKNTFVDVMKLKIEDELDNLSISIQETFSRPITNFTFSTLLSCMENNKIGTKSTRGNIIDTLIKRNYVKKMNSFLIPTSLGLHIIEIINKYANKLLFPDFTASFEFFLTLIETGKKNGFMLLESHIKDLINSLLSLPNFTTSTEYIPKLQTKEKNYLGICPVCKTGKLNIIRSKKTKKRFVSCSNFFLINCKAISPLPQHGIIKPLKKKCVLCNWPKINIYYPWKRTSKSFCVNIDCTSKIK
ncbi:MAG: DNA topoisomerase I [Nitrososphaeraceae archaeon]